VPAARSGRYTPDVSFSASGHDGYFGCFAAGGNSCVSSGGSYTFEYFYGTSAAAPGMAGVAALLDQKLGAAQGNLNPEIYQLAAGVAAVFHDVTVATSGVTSCSVTVPSMCNNSIPSATGLTGGQAGYLVGTGYDEVTGLGSLDVGNFLSNFSALPVIASFTISPSTISSGGTADLTITLSRSASAGGAAISLTSSNPSLLPVTTPYTVPAGQATANPSLIANTATVPTTVTITASYNGSSQTANVIINPPVPPTIVFTVPNHTYGDAPFTVSATSNSTGAITYSVVSGPATISGSTVTLTGAGTVVLMASQAAAGGYTLGTQAATFTVATVAPTITFTVPNHTYGDAPFTVSATSNSTGAITYSVVSGPATISGSTVTLTGAGTVVLQASQTAAGSYTAGTQTATFTVVGQAPTVTFTVPNHTYGDAPFAVAATSNSAGAITYSVVSGPATISGSTVTLTGAGTVVLQASQAAAGGYTSSTQTATFTVAGQVPTIIFTVPNHTYGDAPFAVSVTSNSSGAITYSVVSGSATLSGSTVTLTGVGAVVLRASQVAAGNYASGTQAATFTVAGQTPTITFTVPNHTYGDAAFTVAAASNSSGAITYSVISGPATISGSTVTLIGAGTVVLQASQVSAGGYSSDTQTATFTVAGQAPTITFTVPGHTYGDAPFTVSATSNSSGAITYSVVSGPATISGSTVTLTGAGTVVLQVSQVASGNYSSGTQTATFTVATVAPTITFTVPNHTYGDAPFTVAATSNSSGAITYSVVSGPATISGSTVTLTGAGTVVLQASQAASGNYASGTQTATFTVAGQVPTISFTVPNHTYGNAPFTVAATSNFTGAITYSVVSGPATLSGSTVTLTGAGTVVLQASQAAAGNYASGTQNAAFTVAAAVPTITFIVPNHNYGDTPFTVAATSNSGGAITYSVVSGPATISGSTVTLTGAGTVVLQASQAAAGGYTAGTQTATFTVAGQAPTITFTVPNHTYGDAPFSVSATSNSSGAITYSVVSGPATISGSTVTLTGAGTVVLQASQVASGNYASGTQAATFTVAGQTPTITFAVTNHTYDDAPFTVSATSNSSGAITYSVVSGPATVSGSTVTLTGAGTIVLQASQAAAGAYTTGTQTASFPVAGATPTITFSVPNRTYGDAPFTVTATSNSSGVLTYSVLSGPATISSSTVTLTGAGTVLLQASQAAAGSYIAGTQIASFTVSAGNLPTITFSVPNHAYGDAPFTVSATSNSTGAITYSVASGPATMSGSTATLTGAGTVVLQASQAAAGSYTSGTQTATFAVATESQTITFAAPASPVNYGVAPLSLSASSTSGLTAAFSVLSGPASVSGSTLTVTGAGTVVVAANQSGNSNYAAAAQMTQSITVNKIAPSTGLTASPNPVLVQNAVTLTATVASSIGTPTGSVTFSDSGTTLGTANLSGGIATLSSSTLAAGSHSITATYSGDGNFTSVSSTAVSETVEDFTLTIGGSGSSQTVQPGGTATYTLPIAPSGGTTFPAAVTFSASSVPTGFTATFSPSSLPTGSSATNVALMIQVPLSAMLEKSRQPGKGLPMVALGILVLPFVAGIKRSSNGLRRLALIVMIVAGIGGLSTLTGCGGGGGSSGSGGSQPQTYNITVTATSGTLSHSTTVALTVQ
jgi:hypothetical protein